MPELPEVETVRRGLAAVWEGRRFSAVNCRRADLRQPFPPRFGQRLTGRRIETVGRRAKYLVVGMDDGLVLLAHLGMSGRMVITPPGRLAPDHQGVAAKPPGRNAPPGLHDHVIFTTDDGTEVTFTDPRRFGLMTLCFAGELEAHPLLAGLGPEPLDDAFTEAILAAALDGKGGPIKTVLLDQRVVAGLGNIYVCESLFRSGISPTRPAGSLAAAEIGHLLPAIKSVLREAIAAGGSSLRDHMRPDGELGYFQHSFAVYGREGEACPGCTCDVAKDGGISRLVQAGRSTFFCAKRQR